MVGIKTMVESTCRGEFLCENASKAWDCLEHLSGMSRR